MSVILAFDSSGITCSAAVVRDGITLSSYFSNNGLTHSKTLLPAIERVLSESGMKTENLDKIAVTVGPGSFTGVKIGVATAKGLAAVYDTECVAVSTMASLAYGCIGFDGIICPVMDARRGMLYNALFRCENGIITRLCDDRQIAGTEILEEIKDKKPLIIGDGTKIFTALCKENGIDFSVAAEQCIYIHGEAVAAASVGIDGVKQSELCAMYLRPPQAERERLEREKN